MGALATSLMLGTASLFDGRVLRILLKSFAVTLVLFVLVAGAGWFVLDWALAAGGLEDGLFAGAGSLRSAFSFILTLLGLWLAWRIVAMAVIQFFADEVVLAVEQRHYSREASAARDLTFAEQGRNALRTGLRALIVNLIAAPIALVLLITGVGTLILFLLVNALLLGRELQDMVWLRHRAGAADSAPLGRVERFALGGVVALLLAIPFINLLAPIIGAASATHLVHLNARKTTAR